MNQTLRHVYSNRKNIRNLNLFCHQNYGVIKFQMVLNGTAQVEWTTGIQSVAVSGVLPDATTSRLNLGPIQSSTDMVFWSLSHMQSSQSTTQNSAKVKISYLP